MLKFFEALVNFLWGLPIIVIILGTGFYFTFKTGFFQVVHLRHIFSETIMKIIKKGNKGEEGGEGLITPFEAVSTAIAYFFLCCCCWDCRPAEKKNQLPS